MIVTSRVNSTAVAQAACSWAATAREQERSLSPVDGPVPAIARLGLFQVIRPTARAVAADEMTVYSMIRTVSSASSPEISAR